MKPNEIFNLIKSVKYKTVGLDVQYCIRLDEESKTIYLLFQESTSQQDWKINFSFPVKPYKQAENTLYYHGGYCKAWKSCNDIIMQNMLSVYWSHLGYNIIIAGWSYGGAIAQIAAEDWYYRTFVKAGVVTFGSPQPFFGNKTKIYVKSCCAYACNYSIKNDIVPYMPPIGYYCMNKIMIGENYNFIKLFNPYKYHTMYGDDTLYV